MPTQDLRYYVDLPAGMEKRAVTVEGVNKPMLQLLDSINGAFRPGAQQHSLRSLRSQRSQRSSAHDAAHSPQGRPCQLLVSHQKQAGQGSSAAEHGAVDRVHTHAAAAQAAVSDCEACGVSCRHSHGPHGSDGRWQDHPHGRARWPQDRCASCCAQCSADKLSCRGHACQARSLLHM